MANSLWFRFRQDALVVEHLAQYECRGDNSLEVLRRLAALDPARFHDRTGVVFFGDWPPAWQQEWAERELIFCGTKLRGERSAYLPFPNGYALGWPQTGVPDSDALINRFLGNTEPPVRRRLFWVGAPTHPARRQLCELAAKRPDIFDCRLMHWQKSGAAMLYSPDYVPLWDHRHYKYLLDCPGKGYSARLKWLLASGRPVFIVERASVEHWHDWLVPWDHYVPVREDLADLLEAHARLEASSELQSTIGRRAQQFVRDHLLMERELTDVLSAIPAPAPPDGATAVGAVGQPSAVLPPSVAASKPRPCVSQAHEGFAENELYDVNVAVPVHFAGAFKQRLDHFKQAGLYHTAGRKVHLTLIGSRGDWPWRETIREGWPPSCRVSFLETDACLPTPKIVAYLLWLCEARLRARWHLRVTLDSMTDVGGLIEYADRRHGANAMHMMTSPSFNGRWLHASLSCLANQDMSPSALAHEHGSALTSHVALQQVFSHPLALAFLAASGRLVHQSGDEPLALALHLVKVPTAVNPVTTKDFAPDQLTLAGGSLLQIQAVNWDQPPFSALAAAMLHGERRRLAEMSGDLVGMVERPLPFGRCVGRPIARLILQTDGKLAGGTSSNEARWECGADTLILRRDDGLATTCFDTMLRHGRRVWLTGPYLLGSYIHYLQLA